MAGLRGQHGLWWMRYTQARQIFGTSDPCLLRNMWSQDEHNSRDCTQAPASHRTVGAEPRHGCQRSPASWAGDEEPSKPGAGSSGRGLSPDLSLEAVRGDRSCRFVEKMCCQLPPSGQNCQRRGGRTSAGARHCKHAA